MPYWEQYKGFWKWVTAFLILCVVADLALFAWGLPKTFDIRDEAYNLMCLRYPVLYQDLTTSFHLIVHKLLGDLGYQVLPQRIIAFILKVLAVAVFAAGFGAWLKASVSEPNDTRLRHSVEAMHDD
jgi:hypothetical protein